MFPVKHGDVPQHPNDRLGGAAGNKSRRAAITYDEVAEAAEAIARAGEKVTIVRIRHACGGGGNQAVMEHLGRWRELRRKGAQFGNAATGGLMSDALKAVLAQAIDQEIAQQKSAAQEALREQHEELMEAFGALEADLKVATTAAFEQEEDLEKLRGELQGERRAREAERQQSALAREKLSGQIEALLGQNREVQAELSKRQEAAVEARGKNGLQMSRIAALESEQKTLQMALDRATAQVAEALQKAAVAQTKADGKDELLKVSEARLEEALSRGRATAAENRRHQDRIRDAEAAQEELRRELDAARRMSSAVPYPSPSPAAGATVGFSGTRRETLGSKESYAPISASTHGYVADAALDAPSRSQSAAPISEPGIRKTAFERERLIEDALDPGLRQQLGKAATRQEQKRQQDLLIKAAGLRGNHLQRATDMLADGLKHAGRQDKPAGAKSYRRSWTRWRAVSRHPVIDEIVNTARNCLPIKRIWLFGSRSRGDHHGKSDIDLAFELTAPADNAWARFAADVHEEAQTLLPIDLVDVDTCDVTLRDVILREGVLLYDSGD